MSELLDSLHNLLMVNERCLQDEHQETLRPDDTFHKLTARFTKHHHPNYDKLCPFFLNVPAETVKHTLNNTSQYARHSLSRPDTMYKMHKSPFPACNVNQRHKAVATNTISIPTPRQSIPEE